MGGWLEMSLFDAVGAIVAALAGIVIIWFSGRRSAELDQLEEEKKEYVETRTRMDEVARNSDADAARDWLLERGEPERPVRRKRKSKD